MYLHNLGKGIDDYSVEIDKGEIANLLRTQVTDFFNNPSNFQLTQSSPAFTENYGLTSEDGSGWIQYPVEGAPAQVAAAGQKALLANTDGEYGNYYRVPNDYLMQWIDKGNFSRLTSWQINNEVSLLVDSKVKEYLSGKKLAEVAANLQGAIDGIVDLVKAAINRDGSWFATWGLSV